MRTDRDKDREETQVCEANKSIYRTEALSISAVLTVFNLKQIIIDKYLNIIDQLK